MELQNAEAIKTDLRDKIGALQTVIDHLERWYPTPAQPPADNREPKGMKANRTKRKKPCRVIPTERSADGKSKSCHKCGVTKALDEYEPNAGCKDGHVGTCRECRKEKAQERREKEANSAKPHKCAACGKRFGTLYVYQEHCAKHAAEKGES